MTYQMIERKDLTDLVLLKESVLYSDEIEEMTKEEQERIYRYCTMHATFPACRENLKQLRYAVVKIYFGLGF